MRPVRLITSSSSVTVTDDTVIFDIPNGKTDTEGYSIRDKKFFINDDKYDVVVYDLS